MVFIRFLFWQCFNKNSSCCFWWRDLNPWLTSPCTTFSSLHSLINTSILSRLEVFVISSQIEINLEFFVSSDKSLKDRAINFWKGYKVDRKKTKVLSCSSQNKLSVILFFSFFEWSENKVFAIMRPSFLHCRIQQYYVYKECVLF